MIDSRAMTNEKTALARLILAEEELEPGVSMVDVASRLAELVLANEPDPAHPVAVVEGVVTCGACGTDDFTYEESHPSTRKLASNKDGVLFFIGDFEWFDGDDEPGVVCSNGHRCSGADLEFV